MFLCVFLELLLMVSGCFLWFCFVLHGFGIALRGLGLFVVVFGSLNIFDMF